MNAIDFRKFRVCPSWTADCTLNEPTATAGIFYHGSPDIGITDLLDGGESGAVFFSHNPTYAAAMATREPACPGGRVYRAELATRNPWIVDCNDWAEAVGMDREMERIKVEQARAEGFDCIITDWIDDTIIEIIILDGSAIRLLDRDMGRLKRFSFGAGYKPQIRYAVEGTRPFFPAPDWCVPLFANATEARKHGDHFHTVEVDAPKSLYVGRETWPRMDYPCLIDPRTGDALAIDLGDEITTVRPANRWRRRALNSKVRKSRVKGVRA